MEFQSAGRLDSAACFHGSLTLHGFLLSTHRIPSSQGNTPPAWLDGRLATEASCTVPTSYFKIPMTLNTCCIPSDLGFIASIVLFCEILLTLTLTLTNPNPCMARNPPNPQMIKLTVQMKITLTNPNPCMAGQSTSYRSSMPASNTPTCDFKILMTLRTCCTPSDLSYRVYVVLFCVILLAHALSRQATSRFQ